MGKIEYTPGQVLGPHGLIYIKDADWYIQKSGQRIRQAEFECPHCPERKHFVARIGNVKSGHTKSCGCINLRKKIERIKKWNEENYSSWNKIDYIENQQIGDYGIIFLKEVSPHITPGKKKVRKGLFKCPVCNKNFEALIENVRLNKTKSCGTHVSLGEEKVQNLLNNLNIKYEQQKTFTDLISDKSYPLRFDFYLPDYNCCIEYDGIQHFEYREGSCWNDEQNFLNTQKNDKLKNKYCKDNNISLIRIPYTDYSTLDEKYLKERIEKCDTPQ